MHSKVHSNYMLSISHQRSLLSSAVTVIRVAKLSGLSRKHSRHWLFGVDYVTFKVAQHISILDSGDWKVQLQPV